MRRAWFLCAPTLIATATLLLCSAVPASATFFNPGSGNEDGVMTYSGTVTWSSANFAVFDAHPAGSATLSLSWDGTLKTDFMSPGQGEFTFSSLGGTISYESGPGSACTGALSLAPGYHGQLIGFERMVQANGELKVSARVPALVEGLLQSSDETYESQCSAFEIRQAVGAFGVESSSEYAARDAALEPVETFLDGGPYAKTFDFSHDASGAEGYYSNWTLESKLTACSSEGEGAPAVTCETGSTGGTKTSTPEKTPTVTSEKKSEAEKAKAKEDLTPAIKDAVGPCAQAGLGLGVATTGGVWSATTAAVPGGIGSGAAITATGVIMTSAALPICTPRIVRIINDYKTVKDPPNPHYTVLSLPAPIARTSTLASCARFKGRVRPYCKKLRSAAAQLVTDAERTGSLSTAIEETVSKITAAEGAGDSTAATTQADHGGQLEDELTVALTAEAAAARKVETVIRDERIKGRITKAQDTKAIASIRERLKKGGLTPSQAQEALGSTLKPSRINLLEAL